ncbi:MAG: GGDEF domain-containing protein [Pseudomonadales bacterium]|nr:GGDEF domain-containing protein [Pseudomonadales bacterium]
MTENTQYSIPEKPKGEGDDAQEKRPCLIMIKGDFIGQVYELTGDVTLIGRSDEVDLVVSDVSISRRHAMIVNRVDGFHVSDLASTNGTFVNKSVVNSPHVLKEGDKLTLGNITFKFRYYDEDDTKYHLMLRNMAIKDGLTRVYNKRYLEEALEKEFDYNRRNLAGLGFILFDIDHFKEVNDTHGHPAGDYVLKHLAGLIEQEARGYDLFARYGGEEFAFMLRGGSLESAVALAERVRRTVERHVFEYEDLRLQVTISVGVAFWAGGDDLTRPNQLIDTADQQLYDAKQSGRNCVRFAEVLASGD